MGQFSVRHEHAKKLADDGGNASRKLWLTIFAMLLMTATALLSATAAFAALGANLPTLIGGILGALGIFAGANVATKYASAGVVKSAKPPKPKKNEPPLEQG